MCHELGVDYYVINDWDFTTDFVDELAVFANEESMKASDLYLNEGGNPRSATAKGKITTNWKLLNVANDNIHFNIPKLETVLGYPHNDKSSEKIWALLQSKTAFEESFFPESLKTFLGFTSPD